MLISLRIPDNLLAEIDSEAKLEQRSRNWIMLRRLGWKAVQESPRDVALWKEIERQSKIPSPLTEPLEITDEFNKPIVDTRPRQYHDIKSCRIYGCLMCKMAKEK